MFKLNTLGSGCAREVRVNPLTGTAVVTFRNGYGPYTFRGVSRRVLAKAVLHEAIGGPLSLGGWVNKALLA
jgi:hypothetical protein